MRTPIGAILIGLGALLVAVALHWRDPVLVGHWPLPQAMFAVLDVVLLGVAIRIARRSPARAAPPAILALAGAAIAVATSYEAASLRARVLALPSDALHAAAGHVIAGFYDEAEARDLARAGVAGLFLSPRNVRGRTAAAIGAEVAVLQALRREIGLPPLWIAADQEGGIVATLSPPLPRPPPLASLVAEEAQVEAEAHRVGRQLAALGVNVNFAPVVDVTRGTLDPRDRNSRIALRSLSGDPSVVARGADVYCRALEAETVHCTIKHFPGLGAVTTDTHVETAHLPVLEARDLAPFRDLLAPAGPHPWVMIGHVVVDAIDSSHPASASPAMIGMLRHELGDDGVIVTDDAAMAPYRADLDAHAVATLKGGADLVLASWNPDVAFAIIEALAKARRGDETLTRAIAASDARLGAARRW